MHSLRLGSLVVASLLGACASPRFDRDPAVTRTGLERARQRRAYVPMLSEAQTRKALPHLFDHSGVPTLARVAAYMPKTFLAEMAAWRALGVEGTLDHRLLEEVFYEVSDANSCFY